MKGVTSDHESLSWSVVIIVTSYNMCEWGTILPHQQSMWLFVACTNSILFLLAQYCNFCLTQFPKSDFRVNQIAFPPYFLCYSFSCFNVLQLVVIFVLTSIKHRSLGFDSGYITLSVRVRRAQRLLRTTLPLNWVAGNTLLWQLPFAALGPRTAFHLLFLILLSVVSHSRSLSSPPSLFPFSYSSLCSSACFYPSCCRSSSPFTLFLFFLKLLPLCCPQLFYSIPVSLAFALCRKQKEQASVIILSLNSYQQPQMYSFAL